MANPRPPLTEEQLRHAREDCLERITQQKRLGGVPGEVGLEADPLGGQRAAEEYLDPILRKLEVEHDAERAKDLVRADEAAPAPRFADTKEDLGTYDWNLKTDQITARPGSFIPKRDTSMQGLMKEFVRSLATHKAPEWYALLAAGNMCKDHFRLTSGCVLCERREASVRHLMAQAIAKYRKQKKIVVS